MLASPLKTPTTAHLSCLAGEKGPEWPSIVVWMFKICAEEADASTHSILWWYNVSLRPSEQGSGL